MRPVFVFVALFSVLVCGWIPSAKAAGPTHEAWADRPDDIPAPDSREGSVSPVFKDDLRANGDLIEVREREFRSPINTTAPPAVDSERGVFYVLNTRDTEIQVFDHVTGRYLTSHRIDGPGPHFDLQLLETPDGPILVMPGSPMVVLDASDPLDLRKKWSSLESTSTLQEIDETTISTRRDYRYAEFLDKRTGNRKAAFGFSSHAIGGQGTNPRMVSSTRDELVTWDVSQPTAPQPIRSIPQPSSGQRLPIDVDRRGDLVITTHTDEHFDRIIEVRDVHTLDLLFRLEEDDQYSARFIESDDGARLLVSNLRTKTEIYDVTDPTAPRLLNVLAPLASFDVDDCIAVFPRNGVAALGLRSGEILVIDSENGEVLGRPDVPLTSPNLLEADEPLEGEPRLFALPHVKGGSGGLHRIEIFSLADPSQPEPRLSLDNIRPDELEFVVGLDGRHIAIFSSDSNALVIYDPVTDDVVARAGMDVSIGSNTYTPFAARGSTIAIAAGRRINVFSFSASDNTLELVDSGTTDWVRDLYVLPNEAVAYLDEKNVGVIEKGGTWSSVEHGTLAYKLNVDDETGRALLEPAISVFERIAGLVELSSPPRMLWTREDILYGAFVRDGKAILASYSDYFTLRTRLHDVETGEPIDDFSDFVWIWFYFGPGERVADGVNDVVPYWHWTFAEWRIVAFDASTDIPTMTFHTDQFPARPYFIPRSPRSWYELRRYFRFGNEPNELLEGNVDGEYSDLGLIKGDRFALLREGFLVGYWRLRDSLSIVRDLTKNRPPVAVVPDSQIVECDRPGQAAVVLDGSSSFDPDSSPGTNDDIAGYEWSVDGSSRGSSARVETVLSLGQHTGRLDVIDRVEAIGTSEQMVTVQDTTPPSLAASLEPQLIEGVFSHRWQIDVDANDLCDPSPTIGRVLVVAEEARDAPTQFLPAASNAIRLVRGASGVLTVVLEGPDEAFLDSLWSLATTVGGIPISGQTPQLRVFPRASGAAVATYQLDDTGSVDSAAAFGPGVDFTIDVTATDLGNSSARKRLSFRDEIARRCANLPDPLTCLP